jgi:hypothetical protein
VVAPDGVGLPELAVVNSAWASSPAMSTHLPPMPTTGVLTIAAACDELVVARNVLAAPTPDSVAAAMGVNLRRVADLFRWRAKLTGSMHLFRQYLTDHLGTCSIP